VLVSVNRSVPSCCRSSFNVAVATAFTGRTKWNPHLRQHPHATARVPSAGAVPRQRFGRSFPNVRRRRTAHAHAARFLAFNVNNAGKTRCPRWLGSIWPDALRPRETELKLQRPLPFRSVSSTLPLVPREKSGLGLP
jgi:hypothetical protein